MQQDRKDHERGLKSSEVEEVQAEKHMSEIERQQFQDYAGRVITYMDENGRNTYPLKKVSRFRWSPLAIGRARSGLHGRNEAIRRMESGLPKDR